jgi:hypothetical protein
LGSLIQTGTNTPAISKIGRFLALACVTAWWLPFAVWLCSTQSSSLTSRSGAACSFTVARTVEIDLISRKVFWDLLFAFDLAETLKDVKTESAPLTAHDMRYRRRAIAVLIVVYGSLGLLLLPWPIASFTAIFFFDAPIRSLGDETSRYLAAFAIWLYPVLYGIALLISLASLRKNKSLPVITLPALLPLLSPLYLLVFFSLWGKK